MVFQRPLTEKFLGEHALLLAPFFNDTTINSSRLHLLQYERVIQLANFI